MIIFYGSANNRGMFFFYQVEYAMEAVKQGSATVGIKNKTHAVLVALKRASSELSSHQKKIICIDDHISVSISGES